MNKEMNLTLGSLFDGSGGFPLGGLLSSITPLWASEIEPYPIRVTTKRFPQVQHLGDISKVSGADIAPVDIITFGSPCTDYPRDNFLIKNVGIKYICCYNSKRGSQPYLYCCRREDKSMENILKAISENLQIATIVAAIIMALGAVVAAIISKEKHRKKKESQGTVIIPPQGDPLGHLKSNLGGIKDIDNMDPQSDEYYKALAARIALQKNDKTIVKISRRGQNGS